MKTLKKVGIILLILLVAVVSLGLLISKEVEIKTGHIFDAPPNYVFNVINDMQNLPEWNDWIKADGQIKVEYGEKTMGEGASYKWSSPTSGKGEVRFTKVVPNDSIEALMIFDDEKESNVTYVFAQQDKQTKVDLELRTQIGFPYNLMKWFFKHRMKKSYAKNFENLTQVVSAHQAGTYAGYKIEEYPMPEKHYMINRDEVALNNIQKFYTQNLGALFMKIQTQGLTMDGMPSALFYKYDEYKGVTDMAAAIPVSEVVDVPGLMSQYVPAAPALVINYYGDYSATGRAHKAMEDYMRDRSLFTNPPVVEEYVTDPSAEKDPSKWLTKIIYYFTTDNK